MIFSDTMQLLARALRVPWRHSRRTEITMKKRKYSKTATGCLLLFMMFLLVYQLCQLPSSLLLKWKICSMFESSETETNVVFKQDPRTPSSLQSPQPREINCDRSHKSYDLCTINGPTVLDPTTLTFYLMDPARPSPPPSVLEKIRPYPRKWENLTMAGIKELTLTSSPETPPCKIQHNAPALVFSAGGYTGNFFHEFNDGFVPLFITVNSIFQDQEDFVLVISRARDWWARKYSNLLHAFSKHPIVNLDNDTSTHCFTSATIGLMSHGFMTIDPKLIPNEKTFNHFRAFLARAYDHRQNHPPKFSSTELRPKLVLMSRNGRVGRVLLNQNDVETVAKEIGFQVTIFEPKPSTPLHEAYALINSSHAMVGVHGAALTHSLFLRRGAVLVQVVPLGNDWVAEACFGKPAKDMGLAYMEYRIGAEESSLIDKYDRTSLVIKDPVAFRGKEWSSDVMNIYLKEQDVRLDLDRFRDYLENAYLMAWKFMDNEG